MAAIDDQARDYLRVREAAAFLRLSSSAVKRIPPEELPYSRVAKRGDRRYLVADLEAYIDARRVDGR